MNNIDTQILRVLNEPKFRARTIGGIAKELGITRRIIVHRLQRSKALNQQVKIYPFRSKTGDVMIISRERFDKTATIKERFVDAFATKRAEIK
ncbi:hypothetical protein B9J90_13760 [Vibrio sp. V09_P4A23P171]|uniref:AsnC family transcriptional regulator n=1 Tax=bacterium 19MO03SA05 TaxID=2920620 RepID=A0AAU6VJH4_UNCXX|nr:MULTISPECIES: hypothetical protein [Vibrio]EKO3922581.1 hypothetical protein [Vibrio metschnikovii]AWB72161.1 hypothetical protein Sa5Y_VCA03059 [Vibrio cholerae]EJK2417435.1 hypothetical protein [Vibrio cholerae]EJL7013007.1 hypothetical protein [Vibrio cholerae]EJL8259162.1 hypothetical protein [Vibrio cholerae]